MNKKELTARLTAIEAERETILKELAKPEQTPEQFVMQQFSKCKPVFYENGVFWMAGDQWVFAQDFKNKYFEVRYSMVWKVLGADFGLEYQQIKDIISGTLGRPLNLKGFATTQVFNTASETLGRPLNLKGLATRCMEAECMSNWEDRSI